MRGRKAIPRVAPSRPRAPLWGYFVLSHGWSWLFWSIAVLWEGDVWSSPARLFVYLGGVGPLLGGIVMTRVAHGREGLAELWSRIVDPRRIPPRWLAAALLLPPLFMGGGIALVELIGGAGGAVDAMQARQLLSEPIRLLPFALSLLLFGPFPEEVGWRGYALDGLQERWGALRASLILGGAWAVWHAPLFFITGYYGEAGSPEPVLFTVGILLNSVLYTWIYNHTQRSVLAAILFHFMINFVGTLLEGSVVVEWARTLATATVAAAVAWTWGARESSGGSQAQRQPISQPEEAG